MAVEKSSDLSKVLTKRVSGHKDKVRALAWNCDGRRLASGSADKTVKVWVPEKDTRNGTEMKGHKGDVTAIRWDPTHPDRFATCSSTSADKAVYFWDIRQSQPTAVVETAGADICMSWSPDGSTVIVSNRNDVCRWISVTEQRVTKEFKSNFEINEAIFSHNGSLLLATREGNIDIKTFPDEEHVHTIAASSVPTMVISLDPRGRYLAAGSNDATTTLWETDDWTCIRTNGDHEEPIRFCSFSHDGHYLATHSGEKDIHITEAASGIRAHSIAVTDRLDAAAWHPAKLMLAYASEEKDLGRPNGNFRIWGL